MPEPATRRAAQVQYAMEMTTIDGTVPLPTVTYGLRHPARSSARPERPPSSHAGLLHRRDPAVLAGRRHVHQSQDPEVATESLCRWAAAVSVVTGRRRSGTPSPGGVLDRRRRCSDEPGLQAGDGVEQARQGAQAEARLHQERSTARRSPSPARAARPRRRSRPASRTRSGTRPATATTRSARTRTTRTATGRTRRPRPPARTRTTRTATGRTRRPPRPVTRTTRTATGRTRRPPSTCDPNNPTCNGNGGGGGGGGNNNSTSRDGDRHPGRPRRRRRAADLAGLAAVDDGVPAASAQEARGHGRINAEAGITSGGAAVRNAVSGVRRRGHRRVRAGRAARLRAEAAVQLRRRVEQLHRPVPRRLLHRHLPALLHGAAVGGQGALLRAPGRVPGPDGLDDGGRGVGGALGRRRLRPRQGLLRRDGPDAGGLPRRRGARDRGHGSHGKATGRAGRRP